MMSLTCWLLLELRSEIIIASERDVEGGSNLRTIQSRMRAQNLTAGKEWRYLLGDELTQHIMLV